MFCRENKSNLFIICTGEKSQIVNGILDKQKPEITERKNADVDIMTSSKERLTLITLYLWTVLAKDNVNYILSSLTEIKMYI